MKEKGNHKKGFRMPYGSIALGGVFAMLASPFTSQPFLCFCLGLLVILGSFAMAMGRRLDEEDSPMPWWYGGL